MPERPHELDELAHILCSDSFAERIRELAAAALQYRPGAFTYYRDGAFIGVTMPSIEPCLAPGKISCQKPFATQSQILPESGTEWLTIHSHVDPGLLDAEFWLDHLLYPTIEDVMFHTDAEHPVIDGVLVASEAAAWLLLYRKGLEVPMAKTLTAELARHPGRVVPAADLGRIGLHHAIVPLDPRTGKLRRFSPVETGSLLASPFKQ